MSSCSIPHSTGDGGLSIPRIIINQLKWLDRVVDSKVVISVMIGFVVILTYSVITAIKVVTVFSFLLIIRSIIMYSCI